MSDTRPTVVTTRDRPGRLDELLSAAGIEVLHVPLIVIADTDDPALPAALDRLADFDWLVVTSVHGAERVGRSAASAPHLRLAAVGTTTAARLAQLAGRDVDVVPGRQTAADLVEAFPVGGGARVLVAQADRAEPTLIDGLGDRGYEVTPVVAYHTVLRRPQAEERTAMLNADAVAFASGSAADAWAASVGTETPPIVAAIGPITAQVATQCGLQVSHIAADYSIEGLATTLISALTQVP